MSQFKKVKCTCTDGYTCRNLEDPNCCAHNCDYNDLVDAIKALQAERDALVDKVQHFHNQYEISESVVKALTGQKGMLMQEVRQLKANNSDLSILLERQVRLSNKLSIAMAGHRKIFTDKQIMLADEHLSAHDAEVAKAAINDFANHLVDIGYLRSAYPAEEYAAQLRAKAKP